LVWFCRALEMVNVQTSYEYLSGGETDVEGWDHFLHVPDLRTEQAQARKADAAHHDGVRRLIRDGLLLAARGGHRGRDVPFCAGARLLTARGFLVVAEPPEFSTREPVPLERIGPPWSAGPKPTGLMIDPKVTALVSSPAGNFAAVRCVNSDPSASVWDVPNGRCVATAARNSQPVHHVTFVPDDSAIVCSCGGWQSGRLTIGPLGSGDPRAIAWPLKLKVAEVHPSGRSVAVIDERNRLSVLDLLSGQIERTLFVGGVRIPVEALILLGNDYPRDWLTMPRDALKDLLRRRRDEVAEDHRRTVRSRSTEGTDSIEREDGTEKNYNRNMTSILGSGGSDSCRHSPTFI
jgi:hypothetical protein